MTIYNGKLNKANITQFMKENYGSDWYNEFCDSMYNLKCMTLISNEIWDFILELDNKLVQGVLNQIN